MRTNECNTSSRFGHVMPSQLVTEVTVSEDYLIRAWDSFLLTPRLVEFQRRPSSRQLVNQTHQEGESMSPYRSYHFQVLQSSLSHLSTERIDTFLAGSFDLPLDVRDHSIFWFLVAKW